MSGRKVESLANLWPNRYGLCSIFKFTALCDVYSMIMFFSSSASVTWVIAPTDALKDSNFMQNYNAKIDAALQQLGIDTAAVVQIATTLPFEPPIAVATVNKSGPAPAHAPAGPAIPMMPVVFQWISYNLRIKYTDFDEPKNTFKVFICFFVVHVFRSCLETVPNI